MLDSVLQFLALELPLKALLVPLDSVMLHGMFLPEVLLMEKVMLQLWPLKKK
jgi:hypothetical protein